MTLSRQVPRPDGATTHTQDAPKEATRTAFYQLKEEDGATKV